MASKRRCLFAVADRPKQTSLPPKCPVDYYISRRFSPAGPSCDHPPELKIVSVGPAWMRVFAADSAHDRANEWIRFHQPRLNLFLVVSVFSKSDRQETLDMKSITARPFSRVLSIVAATTLALAVSAARAEEPAKTAYLVAAETTAAQPVATSQTATTTPAVATTKAPLNFTRGDKEHPLAPVIRNLKISADELDRNIRDYQCTFAKRERVEGELGDYQIMMLKI